MSSIYTFKVLFDFSAEEEGELSIYEGEEVTAATNVPDDGWILVTSNDKASGFVPIDYLQLVQNNDNSWDNKLPLPAPSVHAPSSAAPTAPPLTINTNSASGYQNVQQLNNKPIQPAQAPISNSMFSPTPYKSTPLVQPPKLSSVTPFQMKSANNATTPSSSASVGSIMTASTASTNKLSLLKASKAIVNANRVASQLSSKVTPPPRAPALLAAVERDHLDDLLKKNSEYFGRIVASQGETLDSVTDMVDTLTKKLTEACQVS